MTETTGSPNGNACEVCGCPPCEWLKLHVVARKLKKSTSTLRRWCEQGKARARKVGRCWEIKHSGANGLDALLQREHTGCQAAWQRRWVNERIAESLGKSAGLYADLGDAPALNDKLARLSEVDTARVMVHAEAVATHAEAMLELLDL